MGCFEVCNHFMLKFKALKMWWPMSLFILVQFLLCVWNIIPSRKGMSREMCLFYTTTSKKNIYIYIYSLASEYIGQLEKLYCQTQKTMATRKISGMLTVYWPITIKLRICKRTSKPLTNCHCSLWFSYLSPYWLISRNKITFHKDFWCSRFSEFHSKCNIRQNET